ncbi:hypothetical protein ABW21_db0201804 [Orbilia brochopaga]|nr:hypothetical protein ABW21_db0201804 [Drechslerella brochopaga]
MRLFGSAIFQVKVGAVRQVFNVHKDIVCSASQYFQKLMSSRMKEACQGFVVLSDIVDDPNAFEKFVCYCYLGRYAYAGENGNPLEFHAKVYVLAERLRCEGLKTLSLRLAHEYCYPITENRTPSILSPDTIKAFGPVVAFSYDNTYDPNTGRDFDMEIIEEKTIKKPIQRDGLRMFLANLAAKNLTTLRANEDFMSVYGTYTDFSSDLLLVLDTTNR